MQKRPFRVSLGGLNPTGAGVTRNNHWGEPEYIGKCHRQNWYAKTGTERTNPPDDRSFIIFETGHAMEASLTRHFERQGLLIDSNIKIKEDITALTGFDGDVRVHISGEVDQILRKAEMDDDGNIVDISRTEAVIVDTKTIRGYGASIDHAELHYLAVDSGLTKVFKIRLEDGYSGRVIVTDLEDNPIVSDQVFCMEKEASTGEEYATLGEFTVEDIIRNFVEMQLELEQEEPPARTYNLRHSPEKLEEMWARGQIAKTNWPKINRDPLAGAHQVNGSGNWECAYCDFRDECYPFGTLTESVESGEMTSEEAMTALGFE